MPGLRMDTVPLAETQTPRAPRLRRRSVSQLALTPLQQVITTLKQPFAAFVRLHASIGETSSTLAPKFMEAFTQWEAETHGAFVEFVSLFDPTVPKDREGYRHHKTYQAAEYLKRRYMMMQIVAALGTDVTQAVGPLEAFARLVRTILPHIPTAQQEMLWHVLEIELHWSPARIKALRNKTKKAEPLIKTQDKAKLRLIA